jgi:aryl-alcohol dehydrogenase-like predicted oxidoreductase
MDRRLLGATGIEVSLLGLGTVKFGRTEALKYPLPFELPDDRALARLLDSAYDLGVNLLDTAPAYGTSEERLGSLVRRRSDWVICTKVGEEFDRGSSRYDFSPRHVRASVERSLRRLRTDYLDIVLLHSDGNDEWILAESGALETLLAMKLAGAVRAVGISHKSVPGGLLGVSRCDVVMASVSLEHRDQLDVIDAARARGVGVLVKKAFASGNAALDPASRQRHLAFCAGIPAVSSIVVGTIDPDHLVENARLISEAASGAPDQERS